MSQGSSILVAAIAGLLHDIGKFRQRAGGGTTQKHEIISAEVITKVIRPKVCCEELTDLEWDLIIAAAQYHHDVDNAPQAFKWLVQIVQEADHASAGEREKRPAGEKGRPADEALLAPFSRLKTAAGAPWYQPVTPITLNAQDLMPVKNVKEAFGRYNYTATSNYAALWAAFEHNLPVVLAGATTLTTVLESLASLLEWACANVPSATYVDVPDISLFHHLKSTSAIAACIVAELGAARGTTPQQVVENQGQKAIRAVTLLLAGGDMSGIQSFLYNIPSKGALRTLRGRSFILTTLMDAVARALVEQAGLPGTCILYSGGGRFYVILPHLAQNIVEMFANLVETQFFVAFRGHLYLAITATELSIPSLENNQFNYSLSEVNRYLSSEKGHRFHHIIEAKDSSFFSPSGTGGARELCETCGAELRGDQQTCTACKEYQEIGRVIAGAATLSWIVYTPNVKEGETKTSDGRWETVLQALGVGFEVAGQAWGARPGDTPAWVKVCQLNDPTPPITSVAVGSTPTAWGFAWVATHVAHEGGGDATDFDTLAERSEGRSLLGILRMDVDNLGRLFAEGITQPSISRVTDLSARLEWFFAGWINKLCQQEDFQAKTCILYSGGDDLFIVGSASIIPDLARQIREDFRAYTCQHPLVTLSAAVLFITPRMPLVKVAEAAGDQLDAAKNHSHEEGVKNAICFLGTPYSWPMFQQLVDLKCLIKACVTGASRQPKSFLRLLLILGAAYADKYGRALLFFKYKTGVSTPFVLQREDYLRMVYKLEGEAPERAASRVARNTSWQWMFHYYYRKNWKQQIEAALLDQLRQTVLGEHGPALLLPSARWVEIETRKKQTSQHEEE